MKKVIISIISVIILFLLQTNTFHHISFNGIVPDLLLILVCYYGYYRGANSGIITGFFCGLILDVFYSDTLGMHSLIYLYLGFFCGILNFLYIEEDIKVPLFCVTIADLLSSIFTYFFRFALNGYFNFSYYFLHIILPELFYTVVVALAFYPLFKFVENKVIPYTFVRKEKENAV